MSSRGLTTISSIKREESSFLYMYFLLLDPVVKPRDDNEDVFRSMPTI
ncbi:MAG: palindromic element RPE4 domain-containing protein [Janthinobacterium lividum]